MRTFIIASSSHARLAAGDRASAPGVASRPLACQERANPTTTTGMRTRIAGRCTTASTTIASDGGDEAEHEPEAQRAGA